MMKFQGRQTVRNMLVMTLLIAGAYFASFYAPMLNTSTSLQLLHSAGGLRVPLAE